jgi:hypothetical protein
MNSTNDEIHIRGKVFKKSLMTEDQLDLENRIAILLEEAKVKAIESENAEAAAKYYIQKLEEDLKVNYNNSSIPNASDNDIVFLTMR